MRTIFRTAEIHGFALIEVMMLTGLLSIVTLGYTTLYYGSMYQLGKVSMSAELDLFKRNLASVILDQASWANTLVAGSTGGAYSQGRMDCLLNGTPCADSAGQPLQNIPFALLNGGGTLVYDATLPNNGLTSGGTLCSTYPSEDCPFRFDLTWSAVCLPPTCANAMISVKATLVYNSNNYHFNPKYYSLENVFRSGR